MKTNFKILSDEFSALNEQDNQSYIDFYRKNEREIGQLTSFETDEELYLAAVIHHTYGRSLLYNNKDYRNADRHLDIARSLMLNNKARFNLEFPENIWYLQTLLHLVKSSVELKNYTRSNELLSELMLIDSDNSVEYQRAREKIAARKWSGISMMLVYVGIGLLITSIIGKFLFQANTALIDNLGTCIGLVGLAGAYWNREGRKKYKPQ